MKIKRTIYGMIALLGGLCLSACSEDELNASQNLSIASFYPTIVMEGTEVEVTGTAMSQVMEVVFPGGVSSTEVTVVDDRLLKVVAPAGVSDEPSSLVLKLLRKKWLVVRLYGRQIQSLDHMFIQIMKELLRGVN